MKPCHALVQKDFIPIRRAGRTFAKSGVAIGILMSLGALSAWAGEPPQTCTYHVYSWNAKSQTSVGHRTIRHPYSEVKGDEINPDSGCTVCEEDQVTIELPPLKPFRVCRRIAPALKAALEKLLQSGEPITEIEGYHAGRTRGPLDRNGNRTGFSSHAYGTAVDINRSRNGFYHNCYTFNPKCRLMQGGPWQPGVPGTLTVDGAIVITLKAAGFKWGGEEEGSQKDFMHVSLTGF